jgi:methenyltetrahydrofolate cyclohydrolase
VSIGDSTVNSWLDSLAAKTPTPGGGAAAGLSAAIAAALVGMVTSYTTGGKWADREERMTELGAEAATLRARALTLADDDGVAFAAVGRAYGLPKDDPARPAAIEAALVGAAVPPVETGRLAILLVAMADEIAGTGNPNVISDVAVAASAARTAIEAALVNVEANRRLIKDESERTRLADVIEEFTAALSDADAATAAVRKRLG